MKKLLFIFSLLSVSVFADSIKLSANFLSMLYTETGDNNNFLDSEKNNNFDITGIGFEYDFKFANGFVGGNEDFLKLFVDYTKGSTDYKGFLFSTQTGQIISPYTSKTDNTIIDIKLRVDETKKMEDYDISFFSSLGYRNWERDMQSAYGYKEIYQWFYGEVGMGFLIHDQNWHIGLEGAYRYAFAPKMEANMEKKRTFDLGQTSGYYAKIPLIYDINERYKIECSYQYDYYNIEKSNVVDGYYEPQSETENQIIKVGMIIQW